MKKTFTILLLLFYGVFTTGVNIMIHTCGGESEALIAASSFDDPCGCSDEMPADRCCTTEMTTMQLDEAQQCAVSVTLDPLQAATNYLHSEHIIDTAPPNGAAGVSTVLDLPPPDPDLNILHSVFLI